MTPIERARQGFVETYGVPPEGVVFAPGRVNLIGEHVDYNDGLVLPMPIAAGTAVAWGRGNTVGIEAVALDFDGARDSFVMGSVSPHSPADWRSYLRGMASGLATTHPLQAGARLSIAGSIPRGSGLSSSASLCVAIGRALAAASDLEVSDRDLALVAQQAEHHWAGVHCGIMDQMAVAAGKPGHALVLDCRSLAMSHVALPDDWAVMIVQSGVVRGLVDGHYNARRADCEIAARTLGVTSLRDADNDMVASAGLDPVVRRRARHVVDEIKRVEAAVAAIDAGDLRTLGTLLRDSHASLRDLFEVSEARVDALVSILNDTIGTEGGARMTGGGFGGAVVAVLPVAEIGRVRAAVEAQYTPPGGAPLAVTIELTGARDGPGARQ
ncbi:MAG: galactokinase [Sphingomonadales bacterium]|nr:galactokinase [Sphingomonadales bacterium]